jgi:hypothetical protein
MISHQFDLAQASAAYDTIMAPGSNSLAVVLKYPEPTASANDLTFTPRRRVELAPAAPKKAGDLKVALVGAGNLARWAHLPNIAKIDGVSLHAVYSASGPRGATYGKRFGAAYACSEYQQILDDRDIDIVLILSRNQQHAEQAEAALRAGKHVFLEKPMALTEPECRALSRAVEETGKLLTVGFNRRFAPFYVEQKRLLSRRSGPAVVNCRVNSPGLSGTYWLPRRRMAARSSAKDVTSPTCCTGSSSPSRCGSAARACRRRSRSRSATITWPRRSGLPMVRSRT